MAHYGLIPSSDVAGSGNPDSSFFLRADEPVATVSPLSIVSADGAETATISVANSGDMSIQSDAVPSTLILQANGNKTLIDGSVGIGNNVIGTKLVVQNTAVTALTGIAVTSADVNTIIGNFGGANLGSIQVTNNGVGGGIGSNPYDLAIQPLGGDVSVGSSTTVGGELLQINGGSGLSRVNDPVYNPAVPAVSVLAVATLSGTATGSLGNAFLVGAALPTVVGGLFAIQGTIEVVTSAAAYAVTVAVDNGGGDVTILFAPSDAYVTAVGAVSGVRFPFNVLVQATGASVQLFVANSVAAGALDTSAVSADSVVITRIR